MHEAADCYFVATGDEGEVAAFRGGREMATVVVAGDGANVDEGGAPACLDVALAAVGGVGMGVGVPA